MGFPAKLIYSQLSFFKPLIANLSLETTRKGQDMIGDVMKVMQKKNVLLEDYSFSQFDGSWVLPRDERRQGVILYLHGGGYTCGDLKYAKGFGATLAAEFGAKVFCAAYRLAPEHPYPAAVEDAVEAYSYLLSKGYPAEQIALCGESAGGGLLYALCFALREKNLPLPCGIIAISPWTDLTCSNETYETNRHKDPSLTLELIHFYADCYAKDKKDPKVSPIYGDLSGMPPSLIFAGSDEMLLDDARTLHQKLLQCGCQSDLVIAQDRWHAYVLYQLNENMSDYDRIDHFLNRVMSAEKKLRWMRLDNAGKIYPAARRKNWSNVFRMSATLTEPIDVQVLQSAVDVTARRFPSMAVRLRRGLFWYYIEQTEQAPEVQEEKSYPLAHMTAKEMSKCALRVIAYENRIAVEIFHALTDGTGGMIFLKSLLAEYVMQKYKVKVPDEEGILNRLEEPKEEELEDSFLKYAGKVSASRKEAKAYQITGNREKDGFLHLTTMMLDVKAVLAESKKRNVSLTELLCGAMMKAILNLQKDQEGAFGKKKAVKVLLPVNLRQLFPSSTLRNFALFVTPGANPALGDYTLEELCSLVHYQMGMECSAKQMSSKIATNVQSEQIAALRIMPLFVKNVAMKAVFDAVGEVKSCLCMSNMGAVRLPEELAGYVKRMDVIVGAPSKAAYNCGLVSYEDTLYINITRNICEAKLEPYFFAVLQEIGLHVKVESNQRKDSPETNKF